MRITDLLDRRSVSLTAAPGSKSEALDMAVDLMVRSEKISDRDAYRAQVYLREEESTTGIGEGIAIPHGKCDAVKKPGLAAMVIKDGVEFESLDDEPVTLLFLIAAPNTEDNVQLDVLSKLSVMLMDEDFTAALRNAQSVDEFMDIIDKADQEKKDIDERLAGSQNTSSGAKAGGSAGHKIYTQLMNGVSHMLPLVVGGGILIAIAFLIDGLFVDLNALPADQRSNFGTITPVAAVLKNIGGTAFGFMLPVLSGFIAMAIGDRPALAVGLVGGMIAANGKSGFLGALLAGFLAGYLILGLRKICDKLPEALEKIAPVLIYPVVGILFMGLIMTFIVEPVMGGLNTGLNNALTGMGNTSKVILGIVLGGMTPPCAIALASLLFKDKFTKEEREAGSTNFIMGLAFITEGAIPFAASDPLHVLPSCIAGSAVAGAVSMMFDYTLMAPHGGIFVFPVVGNAVAYVAALVAGTVISALLLGILKKKAV